MPSPSDLRLLLRHPVDFELGEEPAESRFVFETPQGQQRARASEAIGPLSQGIRTMSADPSVRAWATPAILALRLMAKGGLADPAATERSQLADASRGLDPDPAAARAKVDGFLAALAVDAPAVATTPQGGRPAGRQVGRGRADPEAPPIVSRERVRARTFGGTLDVRFLDVPAGDDEAARPGGPVAEVSLLVKPLDAAWAAADARELWRRKEHHFGAGSQEAVTTLAGRVADAWPAATQLPRLLRDDEPLLVDADQLAELGRSRVAALLQAERVQVAWPPELVRELETSATVGPVDSPGSARPRAFSTDQLFQFDWQLAVGGDVLSRQELEELASSQNGLLRLRDQWVLVDPARLRRVLDERSREVTPIEALRAAASGVLEVDGLTTEVRTTGWLDDLRQRLADRGEAAPVEQPAALAGDLRDYQVQGLRWMAQLVDLGLGGILADDMGLGKTVMLIALHLHRRATAAPGTAIPPTLVVCPASVVGNWEREVQRFAPGVPVRRLHGPGRSIEDVTDGFVITTYATMRRDAELLREHPGGWGLLVADEAQNVKNVRSGAAKALRTIGADVRLALTGTPVENDLGELWAILDWTTPGLLGGHEEFRSRWSRPIESGRDGDRAGELSRMIRPFVLRRRKSDPGIAPELPPKTEVDYRVNLTREQVGLYEAVVRSTMAEIASAQGMARRGLVVKLLTQLKQICNHPAQFLRQPTSRLSGRSGKLAVLDELLDDIVPSDGAALVFTQYAQMGHLLSRHLQERGVGAQFLHGGTPVRTREKMVRRFQAGEVPVFLLSLRAAGTGLNLTRADHVIHFDRWWNPAVEDQATDRAHRIGQTHPVQVHRLICEGTIEESVAELIASKRSLADAVVNAADGALTELSDAELADLVRLRR